MTWLHVDVGINVGINYNNTLIFILYSNLLYTMSFLWLGYLFFFWLLQYLHYTVILNIGEGGVKYLCYLNYLFLKVMLSNVGIINYDCMKTVINYNTITE